MPINSRRKGKKAERVIAGVLSKWTGRKFASTPASGGLNWQKANVAGDVVCTHEGHYFPFAVEVKNYTKIDFSHLITPGIKNVEILDFWAQCERDAKKCNKIPMLLMRYNGLPKEFYYLVLDVNYWTAFRQENMFTVLGAVKTTLTFWDKNKDLKLIIMPSSEFFKISYKTLKKFTKAYIHEKIKGRKG
jgi:hypothetical protein